MPMKREARTSLTFLLTCIDCDGTLRVLTHEHDSTGFAAARIAGSQRGWSFTKGLERCAGCTRRATGKVPTRAKAKTSTKR